MEVRKIVYSQETEFEAYKNNVYSQCGEDGIIKYLLSKMKLDGGYFVEFGAWDGKHLSNCALLAEQGWSGCFIEGDAGKYQDLVASYAGSANVSLLHQYVEPRGPQSLDNLLASVKAPHEITLLSIDIDGNDYHVWKHFTQFKPLITVIEFNPTIPADMVYVQDEDQDENFGNSLAALWELAKAKGYELAAATEWNAFFVTTEACNMHDIPTYTPNQIKSTKYESSFFQGYNGQVMLEGLTDMLWHGIPINKEKLQMLPKALRKIPVGQSDKYFQELQAFKNNPSK